MKIRNGFVSNSSSSSFVVLLPENFVENLDFSKYTDEDLDFPVERFKDAINQLINNEQLWDEELYDLLNDKDHDDLPDVFYDILNPYVIAEMNSGPDDGKWCVANKTKIKEILVDEI